MNWDNWIKEYISQMVNRDKKIKHLKYIIKHTIGVSKKDLLLENENLKKQISKVCSELKEKELTYYNQSIALECAFDEVKKLRKKIKELENENSSCGRPTSPSR